MTVQKVKVGMILRNVECTSTSIVQALTSAVFNDNNGGPNSYCEFKAVDLISQQLVTFGAANPPQAYAPNLELLGWATPFLPPHYKEQ